MRAAAALPGARELMLQIGTEALDVGVGDVSDVGPAPKREGLHRAIARPISYDCSSLTATC